MLSTVWNEFRIRSKKRKVYEIIYRLYKVYYGLILFYAFMLLETHCCDIFKLSFFDSHVLFDSLWWLRKIKPKEKEKRDFYERKKLEKVSSSSLPSLVSFVTYVCVPSNGKVRPHCFIYSNYPYYRGPILYRLHVVLYRHLNQPSHETIPVATYCRSRLVICLIRRFVPHTPSHATTPGTEHQAGLLPSSEGNYT